VLAETFFRIQKIPRPSLSSTWEGLYRQRVLFLRLTLCPATGACTNPRLGTSGRGVAYGPGFWKIDFSVFKNILITERFRFQFRWETFNLFNHTNPNTVNTTQTSATFGRISGYRDPREMQFGFKLAF
jgi:hypothetical protein